MNFVKRFATAAIAMSLGVSLGLVGCQSSPQEAEAGRTPVTVVLDWVPNTNHTGLYVALEKGYYKDAGLDVTIMQPPEDGALPLVATGGADFGISFQEDMAAALTMDSPMPVKAVAAVIAHNTSGIISLKETGITRPRDMEGHSYATWNLPIEQAILRDVITKDGGDMAGISMIPSTVTDVVTALSTDIDAVWIYYAWDGVATALNGLDTNFFYFKDIEPALDYYTPILCANTDYLENQPDTAKAFLAATAKGYQDAVENPDEAANILCQAVPELNKDLIKASQQYLAEQYIADSPYWGYIDQQRWDNFFTWLYDNAVLSKKCEPGQGFTNAYLPQ